jgi:haloalkane dehalogenase
LLEIETPKIFFHAAPGIFLPPSRAAFYREHLASCRAVDPGEGYHYLQEDYPDRIG